MKNLKIKFLAVLLIAAVVCGTSMTSKATKRVAIDPPGDNPTFNIDPPGDDKDA